MNVRACEYNICMCLGSSLRVYVQVGPEVINDESKKVFQPKHVKKL
jgi:hypothetical protein